MTTQTKVIATGCLHIYGQVSVNGKSIKSYNFSDCGDNSVEATALTDVYVGGCGGKDYKTNLNGWSEMVVVPAGKKFRAKIVYEGSIYDFAEIEVEIF